MGDDIRYGDCGRVSASRVADVERAGYNGNSKRPGGGSGRHAIAADHRAGSTWEQWRAAGNDEGSLIADPLFVNAAKRDFRLREGSPTEKIAFKPFDFRQAGVYGDDAWKKLAESNDYPKPIEVPHRANR